METVVKEAPKKFFWYSVLAMLVVELILFICKLAYTKFKDYATAVAEAEALAATNNGQPVTQQSITEQPQSLEHFNIKDTLKEAETKMMALMSKKKLESAV